MHMKLESQAKLKLKLKKNNILTLQVNDISKVYGGTVISKGGEPQAAARSAGVTASEELKVSP